MTRFWHLAAVVFAVLLISAVPRSGSTAGLPAGLPEDSPHEGSRQWEALMDFQRDPVANAEALIESVATTPVQQLPVAMLLGAADANLRLARFRAARRSFAEVARRRPGPPWATYADLGLAWTALVLGNPALAEEHYGKVPEDSNMRPIAQVMSGWLGAVSGRHDEAIRVLDFWSETGTTDHVRRVALLGSAYARYWSGNFRDAATRFDELAGSSSLRFADDARYGAAWCRFRIGDETKALADLVALAEATPRAPGEYVSSARIRLAPRSVLRAGRRAAAAIPSYASPEMRMEAFLDGDGHALARAALERLQRTPSVDEPPADQRQRTVARGVVMEGPRDLAGALHATDERGGAVAGDQVHGGRAWAVIVLALLSIALWRRSRPLRRPRRSGPRQSRSHRLPRRR